MQLCTVYIASGDKLSDQISPYTSILNQSTESTEMGASIEKMYTVNKSVRCENLILMIDK